MLLCFALNIFSRFSKGSPYKSTYRLDPEGGHMFIEKFILPLFSDPEGGRMYFKFLTYDHLRGRFVANID